MAMDLDALLIRLTRQLDVMQKAAPAGEEGHGDNPVLAKLDAISAKLDEVLDQLQTIEDDVGEVAEGAHEAASKKKPSSKK